METVSPVRTGKVWKFGDNIDTEVLCPLEAFFLPEGEQATYLFRAVRPDWTSLVGPGDVVVAGRNFGQGSGRPAARSFKILGLTCVIAESLNGLYFRNSINYGFWSLECPGVHDAFEEGDMAQVDFAHFTVTNPRTGTKLQIKSVPPELVSTVQAGGLYAQLEMQGYLAPIKAEA